MKEGYPIIGTKRHYVDLSTGEIITEKNNFIESLTHDSIVIQQPNEQLRVIEALKGQLNQKQ
jgi:hypothetical protein